MAGNPLIIWNKNELQVVYSKSIHCIDKGHGLLGHRSYQKRNHRVILSQDAENVLTSDAKKWPKDSIESRNEYTSVVTMGVIINDE